MGTQKFDLEDRCLGFAKEVRSFLRSLPTSLQHKIDGAQLLRSSGSVGANYIEANDSLGKKDFIMRLRIARKEAKETRYWLSLFEHLGDKGTQAQERLIQESSELIRILSAIIAKIKT